MGVNRTLRFEPFVPGEHVSECSTCGRKKLGKKAAVACFHPNDPPVYAAVYCAWRISGLWLACPGT